MQRGELAARLVDADNAEREALLRQNSALTDAKLARFLKDLCLAAWSTEPPKALAAAESLKLLSKFNSHPEIGALSAWASGLEALVLGRLETAITILDESRERFLAVGEPHDAAATQVSKLIALALLGRYDEAIECGLQARSWFLAHDDQLAAGKIEHNIGNLHFRRDQYREAEYFQSSARKRFTELNDQKQLATINNCLANTHALLHKFDSAEELFGQALQQAEAVGLPVTLAETEGNIGNFALQQGRYDRALDYLERSRRHYTVLGMPHQSATAELEIAEAYLELNLGVEAATIYERVAKQFLQLGMRAEAARALAQQGRAAITLGNFEQARVLLDDARSLYQAEGNVVGAAMVNLTAAQLAYQQKNYKAAGSIARTVERELVNSGSWRKILQARWLTGEVDRLLGKTVSARKTLEQTLQEANTQQQLEVAERCLTSLGLLAMADREFDLAEAWFQRAIALIEELRAPLPGEEFRAAFLANKLVPYTELVRLRLESGPERIVEALSHVERARSRALVEAFGESPFWHSRPRDTFEVKLQQDLETARRELNYLYNQADREKGESGIQDLRAAIHERERKIAETMRQLAHRIEPAFTRVETLDVSQLQRDLGEEAALVEYTTLDDELLAFVVTNETVEVVRGLATEEEVSNAVQQLRFQIDTLSHGSKAIRRHLPELTRRTKQHLQALYDLLLKRIEARLGKRRLVVIPHRSLHYLPFQALHDGQTYLIERREVSYAPSAVVLQQCLRRSTKKLARALLIGVADELTPRVHEEIEALVPLFPDAVLLKDQEATIAALRDHVASVDVLHFACHGKFRPDNPLFSSLRLGDGWLNVRDAYELPLQSPTVILSACETGISAVSPGDELIGLARGFFAAGSPTLVMSLWRVDDEATTRLMTAFYQGLRQGNTAAAALRKGQLELLKELPHLFFWSPFVVVGRW